MNVSDGQLNSDFTGMRSSFCWGLAGPRLNEPILMEAGFSRSVSSRSDISNYNISNSEAPVTMVFVAPSSRNSANFTGNLSTELTSPYPAGLAEIICFTLLFFVVGIAGILGNFLVVYAVVCDRKMRSSVTNLLISNLAIADLLIMVFGIPEIIQFMMNRGWVLDAHLCKFNRFVLVASLYASVLTLISICVERWDEFCCVLITAV